MAESGLSLLEKEIADLPDQLHQILTEADRLLGTLPEGAQGAELRRLSLDYQLKRLDAILEKIGEYREKLKVCGVQNAASPQGGLSLVLLDQLKVTAEKEKEQLSPLHTSLLQNETARRQEDATQKVALQKKLEEMLRKDKETREKEREGF